MAQSTRFTSLDLFAGAGGLTEGFKQEGFVPLYANDHETPALETYVRNHPEAIASSDEIETVNPKKLQKELGINRGELDVLLGGPPCQGFSTYGQRNLQDKRSRLYEYYLQFLDVLRPKTFVMENVIGLLSMDQGRIIEDIVTRMRNAGYATRVLTLNAVSFGVPQFRKRVFVIGARGSESPNPPRPTHESGCEDGSFGAEPIDSSSKCDPSAPPYVTTRDAIGNLPSVALVPRQTQQAVSYPSRRVTSTYDEEMRGDCKQLTHHSAKQMLGIRRLRLALMRPGDYGTKIRKRLLHEGLSHDLIRDLLGGNGLRDASQCRKEDRERELRLRKVLHKGHVNIDEILASLDSGGFANKYRRLKWDQPAHTLVAHMARDCSDFVHPEIDRFVTVREAARLQSFPDRYEFPGSQFRQFRQIGNAVPPKLARAIAKSISEYIGASGGHADPQKKRMNLSRTASRVAR